MAAASTAAEQQLQWQQQHYSPCAWLLYAHQLMYS